jgi:hypothetical protein
MSGLAESELVIARRDPPTLLDLIEEPLDQIPGAVKIRAEADRVVAIASWWDCWPKRLSQWQEL